MRTRIFTTGVLMRGGRLLILKRKEDDDAYPGVWDCVGGHFEKGESAEQCMVREAREESGLEVKLGKVGPLIEYIDRYGMAIAVPFLLSPVRGRLTLTEHSEARWVPLKDVKKYDIVPDLAKAMALFGLA